MMNRLFHARIAVSQYLFLALVTSLTFYFLWDKMIILAVCQMLLLIVCIERLIHTTYTLTSDGRLVLNYGRFSRTKEILLKDIRSVERASSMKLGSWAVMRYLLVHYRDNQYVMLFPVKEEEFIRVLQRRMQEEIHV